MSATRVRKLRPSGFPRTYGMLKKYGFSPFIASRIVLDAQRRVTYERRMIWFIFRLRHTKK